jgi:hypothetical protein
MSKKRASSRDDPPGMKESDIRVEVMNNTLVLEGERKSGQREERGGVLRSEVSYGSFHRAIPLPEGVDVDSAKASFENCVLEVALKLPEQHPAKRIRGEERVDRAVLVVTVSQAGMTQIRRTERRGRAAMCATPFPSS